ncbi:hypothetical protein [Microvirga roseola]|uniref:hypothetical protein n=1 Tax=Microvirga roseola TaxID=2883126 RepID=UPI001E59A8B8|nr:hypothetical protein [Microvirga roseola]
MADIRTSVPGSGYGSIYIDSLVWGGTAWDLTKEPIKVWLGIGEDFAEASQAHGGPSDVLESADDAADEWTQDEVNAFGYALGLYESVCGLRFTVAESAGEADIVWWKVQLGGGAVGRHEIPVPGQRWGYFDPSAESWQYLVSVATASTRSSKNWGMASGLRIHTMAGRRTIIRPSRASTGSSRSEPMA